MQVPKENAVSSKVDLGGLRRDSTSDQDEGTSERTLKSQRKKVSTACQECQQRKTKCDGTIPCARCVQREIDCVYMEDRDGRKTATLKRKLNDFQRDRHLLDSLIRVIRYSSDDQLGQVVSLIRRDAPLYEVRRCVEQKVTELDVPTSDPPRSIETAPSTVDNEDGDGDAWEHRERPSPPRRSHSVLRISRLIDNPPVRVSTSPWTTVTDDDDLVSNLISCCFTWDRSWHNWLDTNLFIREMQRQQSDSTYCSSFLVNCVLAWGCPYSDFVEAKTRNGGVSRLMVAFTVEAQRLLVEELGKGPSLPTVQGLVYLSHALRLAGHADQGHQCMTQSIAMSEELSHSRTPPPSLALDEGSVALYRKTVDLTCWAVFNTVTAFYLTFLRPQTMHVPQRMLPAPLTWHVEWPRWMPYPYDGDISGCHIDELADVLCKVNTIADSFLDVLFPGGQRTLPPWAGLREQKVLRLHQDMTYETDQLSICLLPRQGSPAVVFAHHIQFQMIILRMFDTLKRPAEKASPAVRQQAREYCLQSATEIARICQLYGDTYGVTNMCYTYSHSSACAVYTFLDEASSAPYHSQITFLCLSLRVIGRRWPTSLDLLRQVQSYAQERLAHLSPDTIKLFEELRQGG